MDTQETGQIEARAAKAKGFYRSTKGRVLQIVPISKVNERWGARRDAGVPYRIKANPAAADPRQRVAVCGWLPASYPLKPASKPRWWARADAERTKRLQHTGNAPESGVKEWKGD